MYVWSCGWVVKYGWLAEVEACVTSDVVADWFDENTSPVSYVIPLEVGGSDPEAFECADEL